MHEIDIEIAREQRALAVRLVWFKMYWPFAPRRREARSDPAGLCIVRFSVADIHVPVMLRSRCSTRGGLVMKLRCGFASIRLRGYRQRGPPRSTHGVRPVGRRSRHRR